MTGSVKVEWVFFSEAKKFCRCAGHFLKSSYRNSSKYTPLVPTDISILIQPEIDVE
jgi:hypothetical protein